MFVAPAERRERGEREGLGVDMVSVNHLPALRKHRVLLPRHGSAGAALCHRGDVRPSPALEPEGETEEGEKELEMGGENGKARDGNSK